MDESPNQPPPPRRRHFTTRIALLAAEVLLILIVIGLLVATWLPAIIGVSERKQQQNQRSWLRE